MLRRALLSLCLAAPVAAGAQTTSPVVLTFRDSSGTALSSTTLGRFRCDDSVTNPPFDDPSLSISWTLVPATTTNPVYGDNDAYRIAATTTGTCPSDDTTGKIDIIPANKSATGSYPVTGTLLLSTVLTAATTKSTCNATTADQTIRICITLKRGTTGTADTNVISNTFTLQLASPPSPVGLTVGPGDSALNISWSAGTKGSGQADTDRYKVTVTPLPGSQDTGGARVKETAATSWRQGGLLNGSTYNVTVQALSAGGNLSAIIGPVTGTPALVNDFYEQYLADGGTEQGGCAGGPAGLLSLLGLGAVLRAFRRRS